MSDDRTSIRVRKIAEAVRDACVRAAQQGYEQASISGLCDEGALEVAIDAIRMLDLAAVVAEADKQTPDVG